MRGFLRGCIEVPAVGILLVGLALVALSRKLMRGWVVVALCAFSACKTSSHAEIKTSSTEQVETHAASQSDTETTVTEGPERTTTTIEEYALAGSAGGQLTRPSDGSPSDAPAASDITMPPPPRLVKRTVTVAERGPVLTESHATASGATETHVQAGTRVQASSDHQSAPATGCAFGLGFWLAIGLVGVGAVAWFLRGLWWPK